ncbi:MAG TPA: choice-of-anchor D domain-containing protein [Acidobacteriaceae bacterium]
MRPFALPIAAALLFSGSGAVAGAQSAPVCIGSGACQVASCPNNGTTSITGTVYAPNGTDPLPNVTVYIPTTTVAPFPAGVGCPVVGAPPSGSPLVGTVTDVKGNFELDNVPAGANIPLVIVSGRWRRQIVVPGTVACTNTPADPTMTVMPSDHTQGDIPKIAIATGSVDQVECVLRKVGISDNEFTDPNGTGRINLFGGGGALGSGALISSQTPTQASLMGNSNALDSYDVLMLPCEGNNYLKPAQELANLVNFANSGGRVYSSHFSYSWMYQNQPFNSVVNWTPGAATYISGIATVNTGFTAGQTLATWLENVGASPNTPGQIAVNTLRVDTNGVNPPTQSWLTLNVTGNPVMQFVFDTPIQTAGQTINQCGRVLYNEYHVENGASNPSQNFPSECVGGPITPQEKLLEYMLFELTDEGGQPSLVPLTQDFGSQAVSFTSPVKTFTWTNNSSFASSVKSATATGDFSIVSNNCGAVAAGTSCTIGVTFTPTALGARTGTLSVVSSGNTLTAALTGTGTPGYSFSGNSLSFGSLDVGASATQTLTLTSLASRALPIPAFSTTGPYAVSTSACGSSLAAGASCNVAVTFLPTITGQQSGTLGVNSANLLYNGLTASLSGNGVDFTLTLSPSSGSVVAGNTASTTGTLTPLAGFAATLTVSCSIGGAAATNCGTPSTSLVPASPSSTFTISVATTSQYTVVGYGLGGRGGLWLMALVSGAILWRARSRTRIALRGGLMLMILVVLGGTISGCSGKLPAQNAIYTSPGSYVITVSATDGFLRHSATYTLTVSAK